MKTHVLALAFVAVAWAFVPGTAQAADPAAVRAAKQALQEAVNQGKAEPILAARSQFASLSAAEPSNALLHYWVAFADWRVVPMLSNKEEQKKNAVRYCKDGMDECDRALKLDPKLAEAMALKAGLQGLSISLEIGNPMTTGMAVESAMGRARDLAPKNPRVEFLDAMNTLHKPGFVGGGADKALEKFEKAIALFATETQAPAPTDALVPDWGKDDVYVWAGRAAVKTEQFTEARDFYKKALEVNPNNGWVKFVLLPDVEKKLGAKANS